MKRTYPVPPIVLPLAIGAITLILGLVLPWWKFGSTEIGVFENGLFPVALLVPTLGLLALLDASADIALGLKRPAHIGSFTRGQLRIVASADALVLAGAWFFMGRVEIALGYWVSLAGSAIALITVLLPTRLEVMRVGLAETRASRVAMARAAQPGLPVAAPAPVAIPATVAAPAAIPAAMAAPQREVHAAAKSAAAIVPDVPAVAVTTASPSPSPSAAEFTPRWFRVLEPQPLLDSGNPSRHVATLVPGTWYLARRREAGWLLADDPDGVAGSILEALVRWAPEERS